MPRPESCRLKLNLGPEVAALMGERQIGELPGTEIRFSSGDDSCTATIEAAEFSAEHGLVVTLDIPGDFPVLPALSQGLQIGPQDGSAGRQG